MIFRDLKFKLGILIFGSGTKVTIFYFHFSPYDTQNYLTSTTKVMTEVQSQRLLCI